MYSPDRTAKLATSKGLRTDRMAEQAASSAELKCRRSGLDGLNYGISSEMNACKGGAIWSADKHIAIQTNSTQMAR